MGHAELANKIRRACQQGFRESVRGTQSINPPGNQIIIEEIRDLEGDVDTTRNVLESGEVEKSR